LEAEHILSRRHQTHGRRGTGLPHARREGPEGVRSGPRGSKGPSGTLPDREEHAEGKSELQAGERIRKNDRKRERIGIGEINRAPATPPGMVESQRPFFSSQLSE